MRELKTSTRHHHSFASNIEPDVHLLFTPANTTRTSHGFRIRQKSTGKAQTATYVTATSFFLSVRIPTEPPKMQGSITNQARRI